MAWHYNSVPTYHLPHLPYHTGFSSHYGFNPLYGKIFIATYSFPGFPVPCTNGVLLEEQDPHLAALLLLLTDVLCTRHADSYEKDLANSATL